MPSDRPFAVAAIGVALLAGLLSGARSQLPTILAGAGVPLTDASLVVAGTTVLLFVLDPLALFAVGYGWGRRAAVRLEYATFAASVLVVAFVGYGVAHVLAVSAVTTVDPLPSVMSKTAMGVAALGVALRVTLAAVAGGAIAEFRDGGVYPRAGPRWTTDPMSVGGVGAFSARSLSMREMIGRCVRNRYERAKALGALSFGRDTAITGGQKGGDGAVAVRRSTELAPASERT